MKRKKVNCEKKEKDAVSGGGTAKEPSGMSRRLVLGSVLILLAIITAIEVASMIKINIRASKKPEIMVRWNPGKDYTGFTSMYVHGKSVFFVDSTRAKMTEYDAMSGKVLKRYALDGGLSGMAVLPGNDILVLSGGSIVRFPAGSEIPELPGVPLKDCGAPSYIAADSRGKLYVVDSSKNTVIKYDSGIKKEGEIGAGKLTVPKRVYAGPDDRIYIIDVPTPDRIIIKIFSSKGELERQFGVLKGYKASNYESLAITPKGEIYINNMRANTIMCYNSKGGFLGSFSATKDGSAKVTYPAGLAGGDGGFFVLPVAEILVLKNIEYSK